MLIKDIMEGGAGGGKAASQAYWNATRKLREAWREVFDEELDAHGSRAMETFENALVSFKKRLSGDPAVKERLLMALDIDDDQDLEDALVRSADLDALSPNAVKSAIMESINFLGAGRFDIKDVLRPALDDLFATSRFKKPRVGRNLHWPRLLQYLREIELETDWSPDGRGLRIVNAGGRGPVAREPSDPARLALIIDPDYI